jgi:SAM-dependent methyltransferase
MRPWLYTRLYRKGAPWDKHGAGAEIQQLLLEGRLDPRSHHRVLDLGCGTGATAVFLAERGFDVTGVDFTPIALERAAERARTAGVSENCRFLPGDLAAASMDGVQGPFDLLVDYGTLDDHHPAVRRRMAETVCRLSAPGSVFFLWCFSARKRDLPLIARGRISRLLHTVMRPGEEHDLFAASFDIERLADPVRPEHAACFLMTRRA